MHGHSHSVSGTSKAVESSLIDGHFRSLQMVLMKTLSKRGQLMSVATKIGIQISAKLGGEIWSVPIPVSVQLGRSMKSIRFLPPSRKV